MNDSYLERLKKRFQKDIPDGFDFSEANTTAALHQIIVDLGKQLIPYTATKVRMEPDVLKNCILNVSMIMDPEVNGFARSSDNWKTFEIGINIGLMIFLHKMIKVFASRIGVMGDEGHPVENPEIPFENTISVAKRLMKAYWDQNLLSTMGFQVMQLSEEQMNISSHLLHHAECFVVAHEFGHIVINLHQAEVKELNIGIEVVRGILEGISDLSETSKHQLTRQWGQEIGADLIGLQLVLELGKTDHDKILIYSAAELVFILQNMLETFYEKNIGENLPLGSHPPSQMRLAVLRSIVGKSNPPQVLQLGEAFAEMAEMIVSKI